MLSFRPLTFNSLDERFSSQGSNNMVTRAALRGTDQIWLAILILCLLLCGLYSYTEDGYRTSAPLPLRYSTRSTNASLRIQPLSVNSRIELRRKLGTFFKNHLVIDQQNTPKNYKFEFGSKAKSQAVQITESIYKLLPNKTTFGDGDIPRCSVVGNAGLILNSTCGKNIDKADFVFRCNAAPIKAFACDAGNKTNFTSINPSILHNRYHMFPVRERMSRFLKDMKEYRGLVWAPCFISAGVMRECLKIVSTYKISENKFVIAYPSHIKKVQDFWNSCGLEKRMSTGLYLVTLALSYCQEVRLFGFWPFSKMVDRTLEDVPYHYFDKVEYNFSDKNEVHDMRLEFLVLVQLHNLGVIKLHVGECSQ